jgi:hypothetical protein
MKETTKIRVALGFMVWAIFMIFTVLVITVLGAIWTPDPRAIPAIICGIIVMPIIGGFSIGIYPSSEELEEALKEK